MPRAYINFTYEHTHMHTQTRQGRLVRRSKTMENHTVHRKSIAGEYFHRVTCKYNGSPTFKSGAPVEATCGRIHGSCLEYGKGDSQGTSVKTNRNFSELCLRTSHPCASLTNAHPCRWTFLHAAFAVYEACLPSIQNTTKRAFHGKTQ